MSNKVGRPTKYKKEMCKKVVELMREGASLTEVAAELDISRETLNEWKKDRTKPEFSDAIKRGVQLSEAWWEKEGRLSLRDKAFNYVGWYMNMKNRFKWKDRHDVTTDDEKMTGPVLLAPKRDDYILDTTPQTEKSSQEKRI